MTRTGTATSGRPHRRASAPDSALAAKLAARFGYVHSDLRDDDGYRRLVDELGRPKTGYCSNLVFYLAIKRAE